MPAPKRGLVLSGGGARGAYEAGVLSYVFDEVLPSLKSPGRISLFSGTSVGAVHACYLASRAAQSDFGVRDLLDYWRSFRLTRTMRLGLRQLFRAPFDLPQFVTAGARPGVLLDSAYLQASVRQEVNWDALRENVASGIVDAVTVSTTHVDSGRTVVFVDRRGGGVPPWSRDKRVTARPVRLKAEHALASAAIPFLFPSVSIDGAYFCDGSLRQNTPLSPALRLGADRVLVVGLRKATTGEGDDGFAGATERPPGPLVLAGKLLNALLLDRLDYDLARLDGFNTLLRDGERTFGPTFIDQLHRTTRRYRHQPYRVIDTLGVFPTEDIGVLATEFVERVHPSLGGTPGRVLSWLGRLSAVNESDTMSYLLFDGRFADKLIEMGRRDADARRQELLDFFRD